MELNIIKPDSKDYCEAVGIGPERQKELSGSLDAMVRRLDGGKLAIYKMHDLFAEITSFCENTAEVIYCTVLHCGLQARRGRILAPGSLNMDVIKLGIEQLYDRLRAERTSESRLIMGKILVTPIDDPLMKDALRKGVQRLIDLGDGVLANDIINKLTGYAF